MSVQDIHEDLFDNIKVELEKSDTLQKIQEIIKQITDNFLKPFKHILLFVIIIILSTFMLSIVNVYFGWCHYRKSIL